MVQFTFTDNNTAEFVVRLIADAVHSHVDKVNLAKKGGKLGTNQIRFHQETAERANLIHQNMVVTFNQQTGETIGGDEIPSDERE